VQETKPNRMHVRTGRTVWGAQFEQVILPQSLMNRGSKNTITAVCYVKKGQGCRPAMFLRLEFGKLYAAVQAVFDVLTFPGPWRAHLRRLSQAMRKEKKRGEMGAREVSVASTVHLRQQRTFWSNPGVVSNGAQLPQTTSPQSLQWCFRFRVATPNRLEQHVHSFVPLLGAQ
jgi:hypothetical protein